MTTLPEIRVIHNADHYAAYGLATLAFPEKCPICDAAKVCETHSGTPWATCTYKCGAKYTPKPQCQTHTNVWWGSCPKE